MSETCPTGRTGRAGNTGLATTMLNAANRNIARDLLHTLTTSKQEARVAHARTHARTLLTHAHWALHFQTAPAPVSGREVARASPALPHHLVCGEVYLPCTLP